MVAIVVIVTAVVGVVATDFELHLAVDIVDMTSNVVELI